jgi:hypothetical protein
MWGLLDEGGRAASGAQIWLMPSRRFLLKRERCLK